MSYLIILAIHFSSTRAKNQSRIHEFKKCFWLCWQPWGTPLQIPGGEHVIRNDIPSLMTSSFLDRQNTSQSCKIKVRDDFWGHKDSESHFYILSNGIKKWDGSNTSAINDCEESLLIFTPQTLCHRQKSNVFIHHLSVDKNDPFFFEGLIVVGLLLLNI